jgi:ribosomal protein S18 acetylase RimI-like enzyme
MAMEDKEVLAIANLHKKSLPNSHIGRLPTWMVVEFYKSIKQDTDFELFLHRIEGDVKGAAIVSKKGFGATKKMLPKFAYILFLIKNPIQVLKSLLSTARSSEPMSDINIEFLFVDTSCRSSGIGSKLIQSIMNEYKSICVSTRNSKDNKAISFYLRNGFKPVGSQTVVGRDLKIYKWEG